MLRHAACQPNFFRRRAQGLRVAQDSDGLSSVSQATLFLQQTAASTSTRSTTRSDIMLSYHSHYVLLHPGCQYKLQALAATRSYSLFRTILSLISLTARARMSENEHGLPLPCTLVCVGLFGRTVDPCSLAITTTPKPGMRHLGCTCPLFPPPRHEISPQPVLTPRTKSKVGYHLVPTPG